MSVCSAINAAEYTNTYAAHLYCTCLLHTPSACVCYTHLLYVSPTRVVHFTCTLHVGPQLLRVLSGLHLESRYDLWSFAVAKLALSRSGQVGMEVPQTGASSYAHDDRAHPNVYSNRIHAHDCLRSSFSRRSAISCMHPAPFRKLSRPPLGVPAVSSA